MCTSDWQSNQGRCETAKALSDDDASVALGSEIATTSWHINVSRWSDGVRKRRQGMGLRVPIGGAPIAVSVAGYDIKCHRNRPR